MALLSRHRRTRLVLIAALLALVVLAGGWLALRHSPLASVQHVQVSGVHGPEAGAIEAALVAAGRRMSTLDIRPAALRAAVAPFRVVREVHATASFPHGLRVRVVEQLPVAALTVGGTGTAVAADGVVLGPALLTSSLPTLGGVYQPAPGQRLSDPTLLGSLAVLGAAPAPLARLLSRVWSGPKGLTIAMRSGLLAYFGDASRPHAKWLSFARVLADSSSAGASYIDVRLPERPAAGFPPGVAPPASAGSQTEPANSAESTVAALAAGLSGSGGGASGEASSQGPATPSPSASEAASSTPAEGASAGHGEASEGAPTAGG